MAESINNISDDAVRDATGRGWKEWIDLLDQEGAREKSHREIAAMLVDRDYIEEGNEWWAQSVTVGYEYAKGRRVTGQTADAGFQMGAQKTLPVTAEKLWEWLTSSDGMPVWLGSGVEDMSLEKGARYRTNEGTNGEIRSVYQAEKLRLTWQPADWDNETTLQLYLNDKGDRTALGFHHEKLADADQRAEMKKHWKGVLQDIKAAL